VFSLTCLPAVQCHSHGAHGGLELVGGKDYIRCWHTNGWISGWCFSGL